MIAQLKHICGLDDPVQPHRVALGAAVGMFVAFTPTIGFQMAIVVAVAALLRANKLVGVPLVWISNPLTIPPIFYAGYSLGRLLLGWEKLGRQWWIELAHPPEGWWTMSTFYWNRTAEIATPLWLGLVIIGGVAGTITYYSLYIFLRNWQRRAIQHAIERAVQTPGRLPAMPPSSAE
ncbi:MAG: DUF2062 domain-containing protein [Patescibacteria group bacterium]|nr:DUF2062 domain-containing protein [Patescibacteria group bacterium]